MKYKKRLATGVGGHQDASLRICWFFVFIVFLVFFVFVDLIVFDDYDVYDGQWAQAGRPAFHAPSPLAGRA